MKKIFVLILTIAVLMAFVTVASAEEAADVPAVEDETTDTVTEPTETETPAEETTETVEEAPAEIDFDQYAEKFVGYIFSNSEGSTELMDKIVAMCEQYQLSKEQGYTLEERLNQLLTPENIMTTVSAAFLVICGVTFFLFRRRQKLDTAKIHADLASWKKKYQEETESNRELRDNIQHQSDEIEKMKEMLTALSEKSDVSKQDMAHVEHTAVAVAKMVKDVFLNSKTIDASGKALLVHNYVEAIGEAENSTKESDNE